MIALLLAAALAGTDVSPGAVPPDLAETARAVRHAPLPERIASLSAALVGRPYRRDPAGEGVGPDPDPLANYDAFDCLTFVEEVLALALALDPSGAAEVRHALRYGGGPAEHARRRHVMELQWLPGALADGWLVDATSRYGATVARARTITLASWEGWPGLAQVGLAADAMPTGEARLEVLPLALALDAAPRIAPGSVVAVVRRDRPDQPVWITHVGLVVGPDRFRHASAASADRKVVDTSLSTYLSRLPRGGTWPVDGIVVLEPVEQAPMRATPPPSP